MLRPRVIPCLLVHDNGLVKTQCFKQPKYIGDPINAVRIFNEKEADELLVLDIDATVNRRGPNFYLIEKLASECLMPLCYGGGITEVAQVVRLVNLGVEKVALSSAAIQTPSILGELASAVGRQSVVVVIDVRKRKNFFGSSYVVCSHNATVVHDLDPVDFAARLQDYGVGEIVINSVDRDGTMEGYDLKLATALRCVLQVPLTFLGGAGSFDHMADLITAAGNVGCAAGSMFVFKGKYRAVLISYPALLKKKEIFKTLSR